MDEDLEILMGHIGVLVEFQKIFSKEEKPMALVPICRKKQLVIADRKVVDFCVRRNRGRHCKFLRLMIDLAGVNEGRTPNGGKKEHRNGKRRGNHQGVLRGAGVSRGI